MYKPDPADPRIRKYAASMWVKTVGKVDKRANILLYKSQCPACGNVFVQEINKDMNNTDVQQLSPFEKQQVLILSLPFDISCSIMFLPSLV